MRIAVALVALLLAVPHVASARDGGPSDPNAVILDPGPERTYGIASKTFLTLGPWDFKGVSSSVTYQLNNNPTIGQTLSRTNATGDVWFKAPVHLPAGARVTEMEVVVCDTSATQLFTSFFFIQPRGAPPTGAGGPGSSAGEAPGCVDRTVVFGTPIQIDNDNNSYNVEINMGGSGSPGDTAIQLGSVRIGYFLQVSAPGAQVFNDVPPGHTFFQFIQALAASGITTGCSLSPPLYCPDDPVTRGQMAAFISKALGLHFVP